MDFSGFVQNVRELDLDGLVWEMHDLPEGWTGFAAKIEAHLREVVANIREFELELYRSLT